VNIVYISNENTQHYPWAKAALEAGKHVVCEKPCTTTAEQTRELYALAREKGLFFMEAQKMLFLPAVLAVKEAIDSGKLGKIRMAEFNHSFYGSNNNWMYDEAAGGGPLLSSGIYAVELLSWLFGGIANIQGIKSSVDNGVEWQYILSGNMENGLLFSIKNSTKAVLDNTARIFGTNGYVEIPDYWKARKVTFHINGREPETVEFPCEHELVYEVEHIVQCFREGALTSSVVTEDLSLTGISALEKVTANW
jgi:predicted dehydrogenase